MDEEWDEQGDIGIRSRLEQEAGECFECDMVEVGDRWVHDAECPHYEDIDDDEFFDADDDEDDSDFEDVKDIDMLLARDVEAEQRIKEQERIPKEDLVEEVVEEAEPEVEEYDGDFDEDGNPIEE